MRADVFRSEGCYKTDCKTRSWGPMAKEEIIKTLKEAADFVSRDGICLEFKGLNVFFGQDCIEFLPLTSDRDSLFVSWDSLQDIRFSYISKSAHPSLMKISTDYGIIVITLEDRDGQA